MRGEPRSMLRAAAVLVGVEALALAVFAMVDLLDIHSDRLVLGLTSVAFFVLYAVGLAVCARGLVGLRSWSRGPVVLAQVIQLGLAWNFAGSATWWLSVALALPAVVVLFVVLAPASTAALYGGGAADGGP